MYHTLDDDLSVATRTVGGVLFLWLSQDWTGKSETLAQRLCLQKTQCYGYLVRGVPGTFIVALHSSISMGLLRNHVRHIGRQTVA